MTETGPDQISRLHTHSRELRAASVPGATRWGEGTGPNAPGHGPHWAFMGRVSLQGCLRDTATCLEPPPPLPHKHTHTLLTSHLFGPLRFFQIPEAAPSRRGWSIGFRASPFCRSSTGPQHHRARWSPTSPLSFGVSALETARPGAEGQAGGTGDGGPAGALALGSIQRPWPEAES